MSKPFNIGIVGIGFGQHVHVPAFRMDPRASISAICASTVPRARAVADRLKIPQAFGDWRELTLSPQVDIVSISVPPVLQAEIAITATKAGKHVFAEKPIAMHADEAARMVDSLKEGRRLGAVNFEFREIAAFVQLKGVLGQNSIGRLRHVYLSWRVETVASRNHKTTWKTSGTHGGGVLNSFGSHALDTLLWQFGNLRCTSARMWTPANSSAETRVEALLETEDGLPISLSLAADAALGSGYRLEVYGADGNAVLENRTSDYARGFTLTTARRDAPLVVASPSETEGDGRIAATAKLVTRFLDSLENGSSFTPDFADGLKTQRMMDAIRNSSHLTSKKSFDEAYSK